MHVSEEEEEGTSSFSAEDAEGKDKVDTAGNVKVDKEEAVTDEDPNAEDADTVDEGGMDASVLDGDAVAFIVSVFSTFASAAAQIYFSIGSDSTIALRMSRSRCSACC